MHIYVIERDGHVKIGRSVNPTQRIRTLETQGGFSVSRAWISLPTDFCVNAELRIHQALVNHRHIGEWFKVDFDIAVASAIQHINSCENGIEVQEQPVFTGPFIGFPERFRHATSLAGFGTERGWQQRVADELSVKNQAIGQWMRGETLPSTAMLLKISQRFEVSLDWLFLNRGQILPSTSFTPSLESQP